MYIIYCIKQIIKLNCPLLRNPPDPTLRGERVDGPGGHPTHVVLTPGQPDVAVLSPVPAPAVPHQPELPPSPSLSPVADHQDDVV